MAALVARSALELSLMYNGYGRAFAEDLSYLVVPPILLVLMFPYLKRCKGALLGLLRRADLTCRVVALSIVLGLTLRLIYWATLTALIWLGVVSNDDPNAVGGPIIGVECPPRQVLMLSFVVSAFLIPIIEEVGNRGFVLHALLPRGVILSVIISALLFAVMHKPGSYVFAFFGGLFFAMQVLNYRTLWAPIIAHAAYNAAAVVDSECFRIVWNPPISDPTLSTLGMLSAPLALVGILVATFLVSKTAAGARKARRRP
ncbi:MAG: CPBP family intramembrane glutamic endopeptidase [Woeseia sp.]